MIRFTLHDILNHYNMESPIKRLQHLSMLRRRRLEKAERVVANMKRVEQEAKKTSAEVKAAKG